MGRWQELLSMLNERRLGFRIDEQLQGTHRFVRDFEPAGVTAGTELPLSFSATWGHPHLSRFVNPLGDDFLFNLMEGTVTAGGLCDGADMKGTLELRYLKDASIRYTFEFSAHDHPYRYVGEKRDIRPWNLHRTHTTCYGAITDLDTSEVLSESVVHFELSQLLKFFSSWRLG